MNLIIFVLSYFNRYNVILRNTYSVIQKKLTQHYFSLLHASEICFKYFNSFKNLFIFMYNHLN